MIQNLNSSHPDSEKDMNFIDPSAIPTLLADKQKEVIQKITDA